MSRHRAHACHPHHHGCHGHHGPSHGDGPFHHHPFPFIIMSRRRFQRGHCPHPPHGPPPWVLELIGAHQRPERGEVRWLVLEAIEGEPKHGYAIIQAIAERSRGAYKPSPGSIYPLLQMLEEMELVECTAEGQRKLYSLTEAGRAELDERREEIEQSWSRLGGDFGWTEAFDFHSLGRRVRRTMRAIRMGVRRGRIGPEEIRRIKSIFDQALGDVEAILRGAAPADQPAGEE
jgi:DNA-binding PadR family transcriptional regulator